LREVRRLSALRQWVLHRLREVRRLSALRRLLEARHPLQHVCRRSKEERRRSKEERRP
jgi:hypothetical protein